MREVREGSREGREFGWKDLGEIYLGKAGGESGNINNLALIKYPEARKRFRDVFPEFSEKYPDVEVSDWKVFMNHIVTVVLSKARTGSNPFR
jgi:hypothetical protein